MLHLGRALILLALLPAPAVRAAVWPQEQSDLAADPAAHFTILPNGLRCVVVHNAEPRGRVALRLLVHAGSLNERNDQRGLAHFVEHMAFNGTRHYPHQALAGLLERHGFALGADVSAFTFQTHTVYLLEASTEKPGQLEEALTVLRDFADAQLFDPAEIARERGVIASERRTRDTPAARATDDRARFLFPASLLGSRNPIGDEAVVQHADAAALHEFYSTWYRPDNLCVIAVGDAPVDRLQALIAASFGSMTAPVAPLSPAPGFGEISNPPGFQAHFHEDKDNDAISLELCSLTAGPGGVETNASRALELERTLVVTMLAERMEDFRSEHAREVGGVAARTSQFGQIYTLTALDITCQAPFWSEAAAMLAREWRRAAVRGFSSQEIAAAVREVRRRYEYVLAAEPTLPSAERADRIVQSLVEHRVFSSRSQQWRQVEPLLQSFTPRLAKKVFLGLAPQGSPVLFADGGRPPPDAPAALAAAYTQGLAGRPAAPPKPKRVVLAYRPSRHPGAILHRTHVADLGLDLVEFANGVRLNLKHTDFNRNAVMFRARVGYGRLSQPRGQPALNLLAGPYVNTAGLGRDSGDDVRHFCDENNLSLGLGVDNDAFVFSGASDTPGVASLLLLFCAYLNDPAWRLDEFGATQGRVAALYSQTAHDPAEGLQGVALRIISGDDPRFALPDSRLVAIASLPSLMLWLESQFQEGPVDIGLVGDFDPEAVIRFAAATIGVLPARPLRHGPPASLPPFKFATTPGIWQNNIASALPRASVRVQWPVRGLGDIHRERELDALASVLQERVRREIRQRLGATYDPAGEVWNGDTMRDDGYIVVQITSAPDKALRLGQSIRRIGNDLATHGLEVDELEAAVQPRLAENSARLRDNSYWIYYVVTSAQEEPARLDLPRTRESDFRGMTAATLDRDAAEFLGSSHAQVFIAGPW